MRLELILWILRIEIRTSVLFLCNRKIAEIIDANRTINRPTIGNASGNCI